MQTLLLFKPDSDQELIELEKSWRAVDTAPWMRKGLVWSSVQVIDGLRMW